MDPLAGRLLWRRGTARSGFTGEGHRLKVTDAQPAPVADGILPVDVLVVGTDDEPIGFNSVWVEAGYLASIEYSRFTDVMPTEFPSVDRLSLLDWQA